MYRTIDACFWDDPKFNGQHRDVLLLASYLITSPQCHVSGLYLLRKPLVLEHLRMTAARFEECFGFLCRAGFCRWDDQRGVVWVVNMFKRQPHSGTVIKGVAKHLSSLFESPLIGLFLEKYSEHNIPYQYHTDTVSIRCQYPLTTGEGEGEGEGERKGERLRPDPPPKKEKPSHDPDVLQAKLAQVDLVRWIRKYQPQGLDVPARWKRFQKWILAKDGGGHQLNPKNFVDFDQAFDNNCAMAVDRGWNILKANPAEENRPPPAEEQLRKTREEGRRLQEPDLIKEYGLERATEMLDGLYGPKNEEE